MKEGFPLTELKLKLRILGYDNYLAVVEGVLTESARRGAFATWRCWDKKDWVGPAEVQPPRRDSIASLWKFRLWGCRQERRWETVTEVKNKEHFNPAVPCCTTLWRSSSLRILSVWPAHTDAAVSNKTQVRVQKRNDKNAWKYKLTSRLTICLSRSPSWFLKAWISAWAGFSLGSSARIT